MSFFGECCEYIVLIVYIVCYALHNGLNFTKKVQIWEKTYCIFIKKMLSSTFLKNHYSNKAFLLIIEACSSADGVMKKNNFEKKINKKLFERYFFINSGMILTVHTIFLFWAHSRLVQDFFLDFFSLTNRYAYLLWFFNVF